MSDEERIRSAYEGYDAAGRGRLWDPGNRGYARLARDRDDQLIALVRSSAGTRASLIDVGCGTGQAAALIDAAGTEIEYTGIDLLPDRIAIAKASPLRGRFLVGAADAMPFRDGEFDIALAATLFSSLPSDRLEVAVATEIARVLRPGGWLIWNDLRRDNPWNAAVHGMTEARLAQLFPGWRRELQSFTLAPPIARRLGPATPVAYPVLHAIPVLRSHLIGRLQCPPRFNG